MIHSTLVRMAMIVTVVFSGGALAGLRTVTLQFPA